jgi:hypothetical protein
MVYFFGQPGKDEEGNGLSYAWGWRYLQLLTTSVGRFLFVYSSGRRIGRIAESKFDASDACFEFPLCPTGQVHERMSGCYSSLW